MTHLVAPGGDCNDAEPLKAELSILAATLRSLGLCCRVILKPLIVRCDDCLTYHVPQCVEQEVKREEFLDTFKVALVVGSITIPHLRRAFERMDEAFSRSGDSATKRGDEEQ
ncbi:MAG: hypothetical protein DMF60_03175 [Acidobacteria bacterium]|nr:MAG: hypothetical protein DMF60_03175 [Acidobacteriota bacterium]